MKQGIVYFLLFISTAAQSSLQAPWSKASLYDGNRLLAREVFPQLQRRGGGKKKNPSSSKTSSNERTSSGKPSSSQTGATSDSASSRLRQSASSGSLASGLTSAVDSSGRSPRGPLQSALADAPPPIPPFTAATSNEKKPGLPFAPPPIPPFTAHPKSQPSSSSKRNRRSRQTGMTREQMDELQTRLTNLRVTQDSGASPSSSGQPETGFGIAPRLETHGRSPPTSSQQSSSSPRSSSRQQPSSHQQQQPSQSRQQFPHSQAQLQTVPGLVHPQNAKIDVMTDMGAGVDWLEDQKKRVQTYKNLGNQPTDSVRNLASKQIVAQHTIKEAQARKNLARVAREKAWTDARIGVETLATHRAISPTTSAAMDKGLDSTMKAKQAMFLHHEAEGRATTALERTRQFGDAAGHAKKASRAYSRQDLYNTYGRALSYKWSDSLFKDPAMKDKQEMVGPYHADQFYSKMYPLTAKNYHQSHKNYEIVKESFSGSSSDESEKDTFSDVVPKRQDRSR